MTTATIIELPPAPAGAEPLLTVAELSAWLRTPPKSIYEWRAKGDGPRGVRVGKRVLFPLGAVQAWLDGQADR